MPYAIRLPDGSLVENIPDEIPPQEAALAIRDRLGIQMPEQTAPAKAPEPARESTVLDELIRGGKSLLSSGRTAFEAVTGSPEEAARAGVERGEEIGREAGEGPSFAAVRKAYEEQGLLPAAGEAISQIPRALAGQGAQLGAVATGARLGSMAGAPFGGPVGATVGGVLGGAAALAAPMFGQLIERRAEEQIAAGTPVDIDMPGAALSATGQVALESAGLGFTLGKRAVKGILGIADDALLASNRSAEDLLKAATATIRGGVVRGIAAEMPVEIAQQVIERAYAGLDLTSPDALKEYGEAAYLAGMVGGPLGGLGTAVGRSAARTELGRQEAIEAQQTNALLRQQAEEQAAQAAQDQQAAALAEEQQQRMGRLQGGQQGALFKPGEIPKAAPPAGTAAPQPEFNLEDAQKLASELSAQRDQLTAYLDWATSNGMVDEAKQATSMLRKVEKQLKNVEADITVYTSLQRGAQGTLDLQPPAAPEVTAPPTVPEAPAAPEAPTQGEMFPTGASPTPEVPKLPEAPAAPEAVTPEVLKAPAAPETPTQGELPTTTAPTAETPAAPKAPVTQPPVVEPEAPPVAEAPTVQEAPKAPEIIAPPAAAPEIITEDLLDSVKIPYASYKPWFRKNVVGKTLPEVQALVEQQPGLIEGKSARAQVLRDILSPKGVPYKEPVAVPPKAGKPKPAAPKVEPKPPIVTEPEEEEEEPTPARTTTPKVTVAPPPEKPDTLYAPKITLDYGDYQVTNSGTSAEYRFVKPAKIGTEVGPKKLRSEVESVVFGKDKVSLLVRTPTGVTASVRFSPKDIEIDSKTTMAYLRREFGSAPAKFTDAIFTPEKMREFDALPEAKRVPAAVKYIVETLGVDSPETFVREYEKAFTAPEKPEAKKTKAKTEPKKPEAKTEPKKPEAKTEPKKPEVKTEPNKPEPPPWYKPFLRRRRATEVYRDDELAYITYADDRGDRQFEFLSIKDPNLDMNSPAVVAKKQRIHAEVKDRLAKAAAALPDGPFTGATSNVVAGDAIDYDLVLYFKALIQRLGMTNTRFLLFSEADLQNPEFTEKLTGSYFRAFADVGPSTQGFQVFVGPTATDVIIKINTALDGSEQVALLTHELGHAIQSIAYNEAAPEVKAAIDAEYNAWYAKTNGMTIEELVRSLRPAGFADVALSKTSPERRAQPATSLKNYEAYWASKSEWFADQVSRWATTDKEALTIVDKFFKAVADKLRKLVAALTGKPDQYAPSAAVAKFLREMGPNSDQEFLRKYGPQGDDTQPMQVLSTKTDTPQFKQWFGDSKVVDKSGEPLVLYTGTSKDKDFKKFNIPKNGAWFTTDPSLASTYAVQNDSRDFKYEGGEFVEVNTASRVMPVYVRIEKPATLSDADEQTMRRAPNYRKAQREIFDRLRAEGYDGVDLGYGIWVVLKDANQIKSTFNRGAFSEKGDINASQTLGEDGDRTAIRQYTIDNITRTSEMSQGGPGPVTQLGRRFLGEAMASDNADPVTRFRTINVDSAASVAGKISREFDGKLRDSMGNINPLGLYRQAQDYGKLLISLFDYGALTKSRDTLLYEAGKVEGVASPKEAFDRLARWAKDNDLSFTDAKNEFSKMLEARRLDWMRRKNAQRTGVYMPINKLSNKDPRNADQQIDAMLAKFNAEPELKAIADMLNQPRERLVRQMREVGRITAAEEQDWLDAVEYIPFDRIEEFASKYRSGKRIGRGPAQLGNLPELVGSYEREVGNVLDNYVKNLGWLVGQVLNNDAAVSTLRTLQRMGAATDMHGNSNFDESHRVKVWVDGKENYFKLNSRWDVKAFKALTLPKSWAVSMMGEFANALRTTVTALPPFALKQVTDDIQRAFALSGVRNPLALILPILRNFLSVAWHEITGRRHPYVKEMSRKGIVGEYDFDYRNPAMAIMQDFGYIKRPWFKELLHRMEGITRASDLAVRKAIYDQYVKETGDELLASSKAREFINFRRRGSGDLVGVATATIPFFNAYVQSMDLLYRNATGTDVQSAEGRIAAKRMFMLQLGKLAGFAALFALAMGDEDEYKDMDLRTRNNNWILPGGIKIPVPNELAAITKVPVEMSMEYLKRRGTKEEMEAAELTRTVLSYAFEQFGGRVTPIPTAIRPVLEAITNYSFLTGRQMEGIYQQQQLPQYRTNAMTSEIAKAISKAGAALFGEQNTVSPIKIDGFLSNWFGTTSATVSMLADGVLNPDRMDRPLHKYFLLSTYMYDPVPNRGTNEAYDLRERFSPVYSTFLKLANEDTDAAEKFADAHQRELVYAKVANGIMEDYENTRAYKKFLQSKAAAEGMTQAERKEQMDEIRKKENEIGLQVRTLRTEIEKMPGLR